MKTYDRDGALLLRPMLERDCRAFEQGFAAQGWHKPLEQFYRYLCEQAEGSRRVIVAEWEGEAAGYTTLLPKAGAGPFAETGWPEICDFNVLQKYQRRGFGSRILDTAERLAALGSDTVVLGVGLHSGYGPAQRLYVKRGYLPDGSGVWYRDKPLDQYAPCENDDDLVLYLSKKLVRREFRPIARAELEPSLFAYFDRFQVVERCWRKVEGSWVIRDVPFTERWGDGELRELTICLQNTLSTGGTVWGAFLEGRLKGFVSVEGRLIGSRGQYADLSCIHVSADVRRGGLGRSLFRRAAVSAGGLGAEKLYISAHSSVESQAFYKRMGCVEAAEYDRHHVELEPCDCQLEYQLTGMEEISDIY